MNHSRAAALALALALLPAGAEAHEKWFYNDTGYPLRWDLFFRPVPLGFAALVLALTLGGWLVWRARDRRHVVPGPRAFGATDDRCAALFAVIPAMLAAHLAVPLLVNGLQGRLFSPNILLPGGWAYAFGLLEVGIALALFYGGFARFAAFALALTWFAALPFAGLQNLLDNVIMLGFAAFFALAGRGPIAVDRLLFPRLEPSERLMRLALPALRIGMGCSLIVVAFTEKFANIPLGLAFLQVHPLNFVHALGFSMSDSTFLLCAASVELLVGVWIALGIFTREIIVIAWFPLNLTLTIFGWTEMLGHLPLYGVMALLLVWTSDTEDGRLWLRGMREGPLAISEGR